MQKNERNKIAFHELSAALPRVGGTKETIPQQLERSAR